MALGRRTHTHVGEEISRAAAYDIALLDVFWTAMTGYARAGSGDDSFTQVTGRLRTDR